MAKAGLTLWTRGLLTWNEELRPFPWSTEKRHKERPGMWYWREKMVELRTKAITREQWQDKVEKQKILWNIDEDRLWKHILQYFYWNKVKKILRTLFNGTQLVVCKGVKLRLGTDFFKAHSLRRYWKQFYRIARKIYPDTSILSLLVYHICEAIKRHPNISKRP